MIWITDYAARTTAARAWEVNDNSARDLIEREAKEELSTLKGLIDTPDLENIMGAEFRSKLINDFNALSKWFIEFLKAKQTAGAKREA